MVGRAQGLENGGIFYPIRCRCGTTLLLHLDGLVVFAAGGVQPQQFDRHIGLNIAAEQDFSAVVVGADEQLGADLPTFGFFITLHLQRDVFAFAVVVVSNQRGIVAGGGEVISVESGHHHNSRPGHQQPWPRIFVPRFGRAAASVGRGGRAHALILR